jgi:hypothetical protein
VDSVKNKVSEVVDSVVGSDVVQSGKEKGEEIIGNVGDVVVGDEKLEEGEQNESSSNKKEVEEEMEVNEISTIPFQSKAFAFEHRHILGDLDTNHFVALSSILRNEKIRNLSPEEFLKLDLASSLGRLPNNEEREIVELLKEILTQNNLKEYEKISIFFDDTEMGLVSARIDEAVGSKSITSIEPAELARAALGGRGQLFLLCKKPSVITAFKSAGLDLEEKEKLTDFASYFIKNESVYIDDAVSSNSEYALFLQNIKNEVQSDTALRLISSFGHDKGEANTILRRQIQDANTTKLTLKDTVELFAYLQLMKDNEVKLPINAKSGNPLGVYLMQMKALDILSKSESGQEESKGVQMYLFFRGFDSVVGLESDINLPPEVVEQLKVWAKSGVQLLIEAALERGSDFADWFVEFEKEAWGSHNMYYGLTPAAHFAVAAELKNMWNGLYLKNLANIRDIDEAYRFGIYSDDALIAIKQNAANYKEWQKIFSPRVFKRIPGISQYVTSGFIEYDRYQKLLGWADSDTERLLHSFKNAKLYPHLNTEYIEQIKVIAENARGSAGAAIARSGKGVHPLRRAVIRLQGANVPIPTKIINLVRNLESVNVSLVDKTHAIIDKLQRNIMPSRSELRALGLSTEKIDTIIESLKKTRIRSGSKSASKLGNSASKATSAVEDTLETAARTGIDDLVKMGGSVESALKSGTEMDDVVKAVATSGDDVARRLGILDLLEHRTASQLIDAGCNVDDVVHVVASISDDALRQAKFAELAVQPASVLREAAKQSDAAADFYRATQAAAKGRAITKGMVAGAGIGIAIDGIFIYLNEIRIAEAIKKGEEDTVQILKQKRSHLVTNAAFMAAVPFASTGVGMPVAAALIAKGMSEEVLFEHAITLNHANVRDYLSLSSDELLKNIEDLTNTWEFVDAAVGSAMGKETRDIRRSYMLEAYVLKNTKLLPSIIDVQRAQEEEISVEQAYAARLQSLVNYKMHYLRLQLEDSAAVPQYQDFEDASDFGELLQILHQREAAGLSLKLSYNDGSTTEKEVDFSAIRTLLSNTTGHFYLPALLKVTDQEQRIIAQALKGYREYKIALSKHHAEQVQLIDGPEASAEYARSFAVERVRHAVLAAESRIKNTLNSTKANVVRYEYRKALNQYFVAMQSVVQNPQSTVQQIQKIIQRAEQRLEQDLQMVYDSVEGINMNEESFNPLKYAYEQRAPVAGGIALMTEVGRLREEALLAGKRELERRLGVSPLKSALTGLYET